MYPATTTDIEVADLVAYHTIDLDADGNAPDDRVAVVTRIDRDYRPCPDSWSTPSARVVYQNGRSAWIGLALLKLVRKG